MASYSTSSPNVPGEAFNPLDLIQDIFEANDWDWERFADDELLAEVAGRWSLYRMGFLWRDDVSALSLSCIMTLPSYQCTTEELYELVARVNERLWLGHFDMGIQEPAVVYRYTLPLRPGTASIGEILEEVIETAVVECDRFFPAFNFVVNREKAVTDALITSVTETAGEA